MYLFILFEKLHSLHLGISRILKNGMEAYLLSGTVMNEATNERRTKFLFGR